MFMQTRPLPIRFRGLRGPLNRFTRHRADPFQGFPDVLPRRHRETISEKAAERRQERGELRRLRPRLDAVLGVTRSECAKVGLQPWLSGAMCEP